MAHLKKTMSARPFCCYYVTRKNIMPENRSMLIVALCSFSVIRRFFANNLEHLSQSVARLVKTQMTANV